MGRRSTGDRIVFSGDYTKNDDHRDGEDDDGFDDIADKTALALWTMVACNMIQGDQTYTYTRMKDELLTFLKKEVCSLYTTWLARERDYGLKIIGGERSARITGLWIIGLLGGGWITGLWIIGPGSETWSTGLWIIGARHPLQNCLRLRRGVLEIICTSAQPQPTYIHMTHHRTHTCTPAHVYTRT